jgi:hypothetical protein
MSSPVRVVVSGFAGLLPAGGVAWDYLQYPMALQAMGHDVLYLEDTQLWPVYQANGGADCTPNVRWLTDVMADFGLADRWAYRDAATDTWYGQGAGAVSAFVASADVLLNVSCSLPLRDEYRRIPARVLIDSDPMFTQVQHLQAEGFTAGASGAAEAVEQHTHHFSFGESIGHPGCGVPDDGVRWRPTRQPIVLDHWLRLSPTPPPGAHFTTVMNWSAARTLRWNGDSWGQKDREFAKVLALPARVPRAFFTLAVGQTSGDTFPRDELVANGWHVADPAQCVQTPAAYQRFIANSLAEFSVAKETYVKAATGWFSCRSACYLAAGRPVIAQDTGWTTHLPHGEGLLAFSTIDEATAAIESVRTDPVTHSRRARELAIEHFDGAQVLGTILASVGI